MLDNSNIFILRLKAATRDLIAACGGVERAAEIAKLGKSTIARYQAPVLDYDAPDLITLLAAARLEGECGVPFVTRAMAEAHGQLVVDPAKETTKGAALMAAYAAVAAASADEARIVAEAMADGVVDGNETELIDRAAGHTDRKRAEYRQVVAGAKVVNLQGRRHD